MDISLGVRGVVTEEGDRVGAEDGRRGYHLREKGGYLGEDHGLREQRRIKAKGKDWTLGCCVRAFLLEMTHLQLFVEPGTGGG